MFLILSNENEDLNTEELYIDRILNSVQSDVELSPKDSRQGSSQRN